MTMMDYDGLTQQQWTNYTGSVCFSASLCESILSKQPALKGESCDRGLSQSNQSSHATPEQISKSTVSILVLYDKIQHSASPRAVFATRPHPSCCILSYNTRNGALTSICSMYSS